MRNVLLSQGSALAIGVVAGLYAVGAQAQETASEVSEVVVTGSFIAGTPEDAALPVDVIGADELQRQGNPTTIELMKNLTVSGGINGDHNQYATIGSTPSGVATVNLRNLGATRTLVLLNGRRLVPIPTVNGPVDVNSLPQAAIGRIEVLKDGAAATYGSDAIGGVVNFITRKNFNGLQVSGDFRYVPDADEPDYSASALWGWSGDRGDVLLSIGWQQRGRLRGNERDFNQPSYLENPDAGYSFTNNPGAFLPLVGTTLGPQMRDPGCTTVGAQAGFLGPNQVCLARIAGVFVNLIDPTSRWQVYGETNFELDENLRFHAEAFYAETKSVGVSSPGYPNTNAGPTALTSPFPGQYFVPATNPGLALLRQQFPNAFPAGLTGVVYPAINFRPFGLGGNPTFGDDGTQIPTINKSYRISGGFSGKLFDSIGWDLAATFHSYNSLQKGGWDTIVSRTQLALRGFGALAGDSNGCTAQETANFTTNAGNNAIGCYYLNPFSNSFARNSQYSVERPGVANPLFSPSVANSVELVDWVGAPLRLDLMSRLFVLDGVLNGELPLEFSGGKVGWAAGGQYRRNFYRTEYGPLNNRLVTPCPDTLINGTTTCPGGTGPFSLQSASLPANIVQNVFAAFAEVSLPFTETLSAHVAARYENYGENAGGDTFNPKLDMRWQVTDWLALRGSVGTTFRAPPLPLVDPSPVVTGVFINNAFRAIAQFGNPNLTPEKATTYSVGAILEAGPFKGTIDYWNFDFQDPFTVESANGIVNQMFPNNSNVNCNNPAFAALQARFTFNGACDVNNFTQIAVNWSNAGGVKTDGVDVTAELNFDDVYGGALKLGSQVTWNHKYTVAEYRLQGITVPGFEAVGKFNYNTGFYPLPSWRGMFYAEWEAGPHNIRVQTNYIDGYVDQRTTPYIGNLVVGDVATAAQATVVPRPQSGKKLDAFVTTDVTWRVFLPMDTTAVFTVNNIFDTDPPLARVELSYDPLTASALGRTYKVALTKKF